MGKGEETLISVRVGSGAPRLTPPPVGGRPDPESLPHTPGDYRTTLPDWVDPVPDTFTDDWDYSPLLQKSSLRPSLYFVAPYPLAVYKSHRIHTLRLVSCTLLSSELFLTLSHLRHSSNFKQGPPSPRDF